MKVQRYRFSKMTEAAKLEITKECVEWALTVWHSNAKDLTSYWMEQKSYETFFYALRDDQGKFVGVATLKLYDVNYEGVDIVVVKLGLGVSPEHRGNKFALRCLLRELVTWKAQHPLKPLYLFSTLIHPVTYKLCCDLLGDLMYPFYGALENPKLEKMASALAEQFGIEKADSPTPFIYKEVFSAKETKDAVEYWLNNPRPDVRFFVENCPTYHISGDCLIMVAPIRLTSTLIGMTKTLRRNRAEKRAGKKHRFEKNSELFERRGLGGTDDAAVDKKRRKDDL